MSGLERRGLLSRRMRELIEKESPYLEDFWKALTPRSGASGA
jgi:hypothetical protein